MADLLPVKVKPRLRGIPDVLATCVALPAAILLALHARAGLPWLGALVYGLSLVLLFAVSATYHTFMWPMRVRGILRRFDHGMVFVLIAGTYTPVCIAALPPATGLMLLAGVWSVAVLGIIKSFVWPGAPRAWNTTVYIGLGWLVLLPMPQAYQAMGAQGCLLLLIGGILYTLGAAIYWRRWPNPAPKTFGYHEVFHLFVMAACGCHYASMWHLLT